MQEAYQKAKIDGKKLQHQLGALARQLEESKKGKTEVESAMRLEMKQMRVDHEKAMVAVSSKVEQIVVGNQRQLEEARELMVSREGLVSKWREEALLVRQGLGDYICGCPIGLLLQSSRSNCAEALYSAPDLVCTQRNCVPWLLISSFHNDVIDCHQINPWRTASCLKSWPPHLKS